MPSKRAAPKSEGPDSPSKKVKTESTTPPAETPAEPIPIPTSFQVTYNTPLNRPGTRKEDIIKAAIKQDKVVNPWPELPADEQLIGDYKITPASAWAAMTVYSNCIITNTTYRKNEFVHIRTPTTGVEPKISDYWVGKILQIRAKDPQNVYALIAWLYWPEELPETKEIRKGGRQSYHGLGEVIASNWLEVVEVLSFAGHAEVKRYDEKDDVINSRLFWRQTLNREGQLSKAKERCVCREPFNPDPDKSMFICDSAICDVWLHEKCLIQAALSEEWDKIKEESESQPAKSGPQKKQRDPWLGKLTGVIVEGDGEFAVEITDLRPGSNQGSKQLRTAKCLDCHAILTA